MRVTCFLMGRTLLGWDSPEDGEPALPAATTRLVRETGRRYCTVPGSKVAFGSPRRPSPLRYGSRLACLSWGRFATCRREEAGCKPAPRKSNLPERRGRLQTCPTKEQPAGEKRQVANLPHGGGAPETRWQAGRLPHFQRSKWLVTKELCRWRQPANPPKLAGWQAGW